MHCVRRSRMTANDKGAIWGAGSRASRFVPSATRWIAIQRPSSMWWPRGGVPPEARSRSPRALRVAGREEISRGLATGLSFRQISARIGRAPSTVSREVGRQGGRQWYRAAAADADTWIAPCGLNAVDWRSILSCARAWRRNSPLIGRRSRSWVGSPIPGIRTCRCHTKRST